MVYIMVNRLLEQICARQIWPIIIIAFFKELNWSSFTFLKMMMMMMTNVRSCFGWKFQLSIETNWITHDSMVLPRRAPCCHCSTVEQIGLRGWRADYARQLRAWRASYVKTALNTPGFKLSPRRPRRLPRFCYNCPIFSGTLGFGNRIRAFPAVWTGKPWGNGCLTIV